MVKITTLKKRTLNPHLNPSDYLTVFASADTNGLVSAKIDMESCSLTYWLSAGGYYNCPSRKVLYRILSQDLFSLRLAEHEKKESVVMRRVRNPIPMYAFGIWDVKLPDEKGVYGFDMKLGDLVAPFGVGQVADFHIRKDFCQYPRTTKSALFFKGKGNGGYKTRAFDESAFRSPYTADTNANFNTEFRYALSAEQGWDSEVCDVGEDECLILRTRCRFNENGNLSSCHYSKIYGKIDIFDRLHFRAYAFNPTPNDPNLEFDVNRNLFKKDTAPYLP